ncbi:MAG: phosphotransferase [Myxococcota bacterium]|nr:phosphotransferase [Myxococcota bacterium]
MLPSSERSKVRLDIRDTDEAFGGLKSAYLEMTLSSGPCIAKVLDLSEVGLGIGIGEDQKDVIPTVGSLLMNTVIGTAMSRHELGRLIVRRVELMDDGQIELGVEGEDEDTRISLWRVCHELTNLSRATASPIERPEKSPIIPGRGHYSAAARAERLDFLREQTAEKLPTLDACGLEPERLTGNIENLVGSVEIPVGVAGPLWFNGQNVIGHVYAPLATTEGALVASCTRGATALTRAGGVTTRILRQVMLRVPLFVLDSSESASKLRQWISDHFAEIESQVRLVSRHARLIQVMPDQVGNRLNVTFTYETGDAAGQNMTTSCTWKACQWINDQMRHFPEIRVDCFMVDGNMSGDKKVNFKSLIQGRGTRATAEALLDNHTLEHVLKVSAQQMMESHYVAMTGGMSIGMIGYNVNIANVIAAMFTACGQDIACVHESSLGHLSMKASEEGLYVTLDLPALVVGTVGGGTNLPMQADYLKLMNCKGAHRSGRLAEIVAGFCLALDLSTASAMASGQFAAAHDRLGRNRPVEWFTEKDLVPKFFERGFQRILEDRELEVLAVEESQIEMGSSIITELTSRQMEKKLGLEPRLIRYRKSDGSEHETKVVVKFKPTDKEVIHVANTVAQMCGGKLAAYHDKYKDMYGLSSCHVRELGMYTVPHPLLKRHMPVTFDCHKNLDREAFVIVMEDLSSLELMNTADDVSGWTRAHIEAAIDGMAEIHASSLGREEEMRMVPWFGEVMSTERMVELTPLWRALIDHAAEEFPDWFEVDDKQRVMSRVHQLGEWWPELEKMPRSMVHNDMNPRNIGFRRSEDGELTLCAYDWELATVDVPQRDLAEFLSFMELEQYSDQELLEFIERHRVKLEEASGEPIAAEAWMQGFNLTLRHYSMTRVTIYLMSHTFRNYKFLERVVRSVRRLSRLQKCDVKGLPV